MALVARLIECENEGCQLFKALVILTLLFPLLQYPLKSTIDNHPHFTGVSSSQNFHKLSNPEVVTNDETSALAKTVEELPEFGFEDDLYYEYSSTNIANGTYNAYYGDGQLRATATYKNGIREGTSDVYLQNGQLFLRATYKYGELDGFQLRYGSDGTLKSKCFWVNGAKIYCE